MKINILDAGIRHPAGHHYDYGLKLLKHYAGAGHDVHVYGSAAMQDDVAADFAAVGEVDRLFRVSQYPDSSKVDFYAGEIIAYHRESAIIAQDLASVRPADIWIWPTIRAAQIAACAASAVQVPVVGCVYWDPGVETRTIEAMLWRDALESARVAGVNFTLASVEAELRHRFMQIVASGRFSVVPHPVGGPPIAAPKTKLERIGFFGHQREEKGLRMMKSLLSRLIKDGYAITYQNSHRGSEAPQVEGVDLLEYVEDIAVPIAQCDLVVLPYDIGQYRARGSGILMECLALGIPVTAPVGTLPGRIVERFGSGPLFVTNSDGAIYQAVKAAERRYPAFAANAHRSARSFCALNGVEKFASALLAAVE